MNNISRFITLIYGTLTLSGGIIGFIKAGSLASLFVGIVTSAICIATATVYKNAQNGHYLYIASVSLILSSMFLGRFTASGYTFMPGGLMFIASMTTFSIVSLSWLHETKAKK